MTEQEYEKIISLKVLSDFLPISFKNGSSLDLVTTCCSTCNKEITPENIRADLQHYEHSVAVESFAICYDCRMITPFRLRASDDGSLLVGKEDGTWAKSHYEPQQSAWLSLKLLLLTKKWRQL
jgi:hypothetical protein